MAEKITIASLDIDTSELLDKQTELAQAIMLSKKEMKEFEKANKDNLATDKELAKQHEVMKVNLADMNKEYSVNKKNLVEAKKGQIDLNTALEKNITTVKQASANNKELKKVRDSIDSSTVEGAKKITAINAKINKNTDFIKKNVSSNEQNKIAVGGYTEGILKASQSLGLQGKSLSLVTALTGKLKNMTQMQTVAQNEATVATSFGTKALKLFKIALASTGIGLLVIALGSLIAYFQNTEAGAQKMRIATSALGVVVDKVKDVFINLGEAIVNAFENPQEAIDALWTKLKNNILNRLKGIKDSFVALGKIISASLDFNLEEAGKQGLKFASSMQEAITGIKTEDLIKGINEFSGEMEDAVKKAVKLQERENAVIKERRSWLVGEKVLQGEIAELKLASEDRTKTFAEREKALNDAIAKRKIITETNTRLAKEEYEIQKQRNALATSGEADLDAEAQALAKLTDVRKQGADGERELFRKSEMLREQRIKNSNTEVEQQKKETIENLNFELAKFEELNKGKKRISAEEFLYQQELNDKKTAILEAKHDAELISENDYQLAKLKQAREFEEANVAIVEEIQANAKERKDAKDAEEWELALMAEDSDYERQRMKAEKEYNDAIMDAEKKGLSTTLIEKKYSKKKEDIAKAEAKTRLALATQITSGITALFGEESIVGKASAIATATINTYLGATRALAEGGPFLGPILAGVTVANGLAMVAKISGISPKFEKGGSFEIGGRRHSSGGTQFQGSDGTRFEAEKGEQLVILNRGASEEYRNNLSAMNVRHGGNSLVASRAKRNYFENGGVVTASVDNSDVVEAIENMQIVVKVSDIADGLATQAEVVNNNTF